uniref:Sorting nexin 13 n=1 Tax=Panagrolaimus sp. JU765 TaxID=591449 RepID=A0AC34Q640_9BILA
MTRSCANELLITIVLAKEPEEILARYDYFHVEDEYNLYRLVLGTLKQQNLFVEDHMLLARNNVFTTWDKRKNCPFNGGGWWTPPNNCAEHALTGEFKARENYKAVIFTFVALGLESLLIFFITVSLILLGFFSYGISKALKKVPGKVADIQKNGDSFKFCRGIPDFVEDRHKFKETTMYQTKHSMTGSNDLDAVVEQILNYTIRDFVDPWYKNISTDELFQESILRTLRRSIAGFSQCVRKVDWVPLLTRHVVDDVASHFRLFRKANDRLALQKAKGARHDDLETIFFDLELEMEKNRCRDLVSTSPQYESAYLHDVADLLLYLIVPAEDFRSRPLRFFSRELLVGKILIPLIDQLSDPDYLTHLIIWLLSEVPLNTDDFITAIETSKCVQELEAVLESIHDEMNSLKAKDSGGISTEMIKQELASLEFTENLIKKRMARIADNLEDVVISKDVDVAQECCDGPLVNLPITVVLTNCVAVTSFVKFLSEVGGQNYIDCYLAIEGFKVSVEHQLRNLANGETVDSEVYETIKEAALFMYHQYLSQEAVTRVPLEDSIINKFLARLRNDEPQDSWFEQIQDKIMSILATDERFYPSFKKHSLYVKMLEELGVLVPDDEEDSLSRQPTIEITDDTTSTNSEPSPKLPDTTVAVDNDIPKITAVVETLGVGQQGKQMFALYNVRVNKNDGKNSSSWNVIRRYSDFHTLNATIQSKYRKLQNLSFPGKKTFNNLDQHFLERRCRALNAYMSCILQPSVLRANNGLEADIINFLSQKKYTGSQNGISKKFMNAMFDPIVNGVKAFGTAVTQVPDSGFVSKVGNELNRAASVLRSNRPMEQEEHSRVAAQLENVDSENIPLRVMLLFVDEVFGLRGRNQWFRRRLVSVLRQFVNAALGSSINKKIIDIVQFLTSKDQVLQYLVAFRDSMWPNGHLATHTGKKPASESLQARLMARCLMLSALPDQLRLFMGSTTTNTGISDISNALQSRHLNRRLVYVILERFLVAIFPNNHFEKLFILLHSRSPRMRHM